MALLKSLSYSNRNCPVVYLLWCSEVVLTMGALKRFALILCVLHLSRSCINISVDIEAMKTKGLCHCNNTRIHINLCVSMMNLVLACIGCTYIMTQLFPFSPSRSPPPTPHINVVRNATPPPPPIEAIPPESLTPLIQSNSQQNPSTPSPLYHNTPTIPEPARARFDAIYEEVELNYVNLPIARI